jgi:hypothetical protein
MKTALIIILVPVVWLLFVVVCLGAFLMDLGGHFPLLPFGSSQSPLSRRSRASIGAAAWTR